MPIVSSLNHLEPYGCAIGLYEDCLAFNLTSYDVVLNTANLQFMLVSLTLRLLMSYIYMEHLFLMFLDHTQRRTTVGRTPLGFESHRGHGYLSVVSVVCCQVEVSAQELITRPEESYRLCCVVVCDLETSRIGAPYIDI